MEEIAANLIEETEMINELSVELPEGLRNQLINMAMEARANSYAPYSHYRVGAAVLTGNGRIFTGCNVENASYGLTNCAERTAIFKAVSEGETHITVIAIAGGKEDADELDLAYPCGACRQVMREFGDPENFVIIVAKSVKEFKIYSLGQLLPESFGPGNVKE